MQLPDLSGLGRILGLFVGFLGAYLFAVWVSMIVWTVRDIRSRSRDIFAQVLAVALVLIFNVAGLLLYFILRPRETLSEKYERELAEEAMLQDIEERQVCPVCHHKIMSEYLICPNCHTKLHKKCEHCGRILNLKWNVCPYCAQPQAVPSAPRFVGEPPPPPLPPTRERKREPVASREVQPATVPIALATGRGQRGIVSPAVADEFKSAAPPDGKAQPVDPPITPVSNPLAPPEGTTSP
jgi:RNA polymerase subunit RPABC4/transcription elongation factor Spt4